MNLKAVAVSALAMSSVAMADIADVKPVVFESKFDFQTTVTTLTNTLKEKGMTIFAEIDHQAAAKQAGIRNATGNRIGLRHTESRYAINGERSDVSVAITVKSVNYRTEQGQGRSNVKSCRSSGGSR